MGEARPSVLLILADDLPRNVIGAYGASSRLTPVLDGLARDGLTFTHAYTTSPLCTPSRYSLLTGRYASTGVQIKPSQAVGGVKQVAFQTYLSKRDNITTMAHVFRRAGYRTGFLGKYHVGHPIHPSDCKSEQLDAEVQATCETGANVSCVWETVRHSTGFDHVADVYFDNEALEAHAHQPEWMAFEAIRFIRGVRQRSQSRRLPFFLMMATTLSHSPSNFVEQLRSTPRAAPAGCKSTSVLDKAAIKGFLESATALRRRVVASLLKSTLLCAHDVGNSVDVLTLDFQLCADDKLPSLGGLLKSEAWLPANWFSASDRVGKGWRSSLATSAVYTAWLDASLESIMEDLRSHSELENTLTIFSADHGAFFAGKGHAYEDGIRVPLLMHWPAVFAKPGIVSSRITHMDLLPTLASIIGIPKIPGAHGRALDWLLSDSARNESRDDPPLFVEVGYSRMVTHAGWKLILVMFPVPPAGEDPNPPCRTIHGLPLANGSVKSTHRLRVKFLYDAFERHSVHHCDVVQLYDLRVDPAEQTNLATSRPDKTDELRALIEGHIRLIEPESSKYIEPLLETSPSPLRLKPRSWCQKCHPATRCPPWPAEAEGSEQRSQNRSENAISDLAAILIRRLVDDLLTEIDSAISPAAVASTLSLPRVRSDCVLVRASQGRIFINFLASDFAQRNFSIASCFPSKHENFLHSRLHTALRLIARTLHRRPQLPSFEIIVCPDDCPPGLGAAPGARPALTSVGCTVHKTLPFISWIVNTDRATDFSEWDDYLKRVWLPLEAWEKRTPKAVFRGHLRSYSYCGGWSNWSIPRYQEDITAENWHMLGRSAIWAARIREPEILDVNFGNHQEFERLWKLKPQEILALDEPMSLSMSEQARLFRYVVHAEGACGSSDRLKQSYASPMLLLKQASPCYEWFEPLFQAWEHYVPVDGSFRNLTDAVRWARDHDAQAQRMVAAANERIQEVVSVPAMYMYAAYLLEGYARTYSARRARHSAAVSKALQGFNAEFVCKYETDATTCSLKLREGSSNEAFT